MCQRGRRTPSPDVVCWRPAAIRWRAVKWGQDSPVSLAHRAIVGLFATVEAVPACKSFPASKSWGGSLTRVDRTLIRRMVIR